MPPHEPSAADEPGAADRLSGGDKSDGVDRPRDADGLGAASLTANEEALWRALARLVAVMPRVMDADLLRAEGLTLSEYTVLMDLSESPGSARRMGELADRILISGSGLTRLIERLARQGLVERVKAEGDGRGQLAVLTPVGLQRLRQAWPAHLESVRRIVIDNLAHLDLPAMTAAFNAIADQDSYGIVRRR